MPASAATKGSVALLRAKVEVRGCPRTCQLLPDAKPAADDDFGKEFLELILAVKVVKNMAEDGRVAVRNVRRDARKTLEAAEKAHEISTDDLERAEKELEKITHDHVDAIDKAVAKKEAELLEV